MQERKTSKKSKGREGNCKSASFHPRYQLDRQAKKKANVYKDTSKLPYERNHCSSGSTKHVAEAEE